MKNISILICVLFCSINLHANTIDDLKTDSDVVNFVRPLDKNFSSKYGQPLSLHSAEIIKNKRDCFSAAATWDVKNWQKADFNSDGLTDLAVILFWYRDYRNFVVIDKGNDNFQLIQLSYTHYSPCELITTAKSSQSDLLIFRSYNRIPDTTGYYRSTDIRSLRTDTLIYKFGNFTELNREPADNKISAISFESSPCYGTCPWFEMSIDEKGNATYNAKMHTKKQGTFKMTLSPKVLQELSDIINYIDIKRLKNKYAVTWTDDVTATLNIKFADGTEKSIEDYGARGTFGLKLLYSRFSELAENQHWK